MHLRDELISPSGCREHASTSSAGIICTLFVGSFIRAHTGTLQMLTRVFLCAAATFSTGHWPTLIHDKLLTITDSSSSTLLYSWITLRARIYPRLRLVVWCRDISRECLFILTKLPVVFRSLRHMKSSRSSASGASPPLSLVNAGGNRLVSDLLCLRLASSENPDNTQEGLWRNLSWSNRQVALMMRGHHS